mgnify:CR=1 FL=1|tara:strand:- start:3792 stop:4703 length:912 start_codon:yes stop_codon:yes gene_type:complete
MAFSVNQPNYNGTAAGFYIHAALKQAKSLEYMQVLENIKYKQNIQKMDGSSLIVDNSCTYSSSGNLSLTEATLSPKSLQINLDICKETLLTSWESMNMRAGRDAASSTSFDDYVIAYMGEMIADATETSIWQGVTGTTGEFDGFMTYWLLTTTDATVVQSVATAAYSAANIIANMQTFVADIIGGTTVDVLGKEDAYIFMNPKTFQFYIQALSALGYVNTYQQADWNPLFEGIKIAVVPGMIDNQLCFAETSNLFFGTDLLSDSTRISLLDMAPVTGDDTIRMVARYTAGVVAGIGANVARQS